MDYAVKVVKKMQRERIRSIEASTEAVGDFEEYLEAYFPKVSFRCTILISRLTKLCFEHRLSIAPNVDPGTKPAKKKVVSSVSGQARVFMPSVPLRVLVGKILSTNMWMNTTKKV